MDAKGSDQGGGGDGDVVVKKMTESRYRKILQLNTIQYIFGKNSNGEQ
jgi:hypothetical protein